MKVQEITLWYGENNDDESWTQQTFVPEERNE